MATIQEQMGQILLMLGRLEGELTAVRRDAETVRKLNEDEKENAHNSRSKIYDQVGQLTTAVARLEGDVKLAAATAAQARDTSSHAAAEVAAQAKALDVHVKQMAPVARRVRRLEMRIAIFLGLLTAIGGGLWYLITNNAKAILEALSGLFTRT